MATTPIGAVLQRLRQLLPGERTGPLGDRDLLDQFAVNQDANAFAELVQRHGTLVRGVCQRVLGSGPDAEDAFQATFLVLARQAASIHKRNSVGSWLYGVAYRIACNTRRQATARRVHESGATPRVAGDSENELSWQEVRQLLDEELQRLPEKYRAPLILCYLEGLAQDQAAKRLGWRVGPLKWRLEQGRERLRRRLVQRGISLASALTATVLLPSASTATVPLSLRLATIQAATWFAGGMTLAGTNISPSVTAMAEGVLHAMLLAKRKMAAALLLSLTLAIAGVGGLGYQVCAVKSVAEAAGAELTATELPAVPVLCPDAAGDPLPPGAMARLGTVRFRHEGSVQSVVLSPDGKTLASASEDGTVRLWAVATGKQVRQLTGHKGGVLSVTYAPDGNTLASGGLDGTIRLWEAATGKEVHQVQGHTDGTRSLTYASDGETLASAGNDCMIRLWEVATGQELRKLRGHTDRVTCVSFAPDGKTLASAGSDQTIRLWETATGKQIRKLQGHTDQVLSVSFAPDGKTLASAGSDQTIRLWETTAGKQIQKLQGHTSYVSSVSYAPDGKILISASADQTIRLWEVATGKELQQLQGHTDKVLSACYAMDGKTLASAGSDQTIRLWEAATGKELHQQHGRQTLASAGRDRTIRLWEVATGKEIRKLQGHTDPVFSVTYAPDGKTLASAGEDQTIRLWETATGKELRQLAGHTGRVNSVSYAPDGKTLASASADQTIRLWEAATAKELRQFHGHRHKVTSVSFAPDGNTLASAGSDQTIRLWETATGKEIRKLQGQLDWVESVSYAPDGKTLASAGWDRTIRLWEVATGKEIRKLQGHEGAVYSVSFSPDGKTLTSAGRDGTIRLWEVATGKEIRILQGDAGSVTSATFAPDGRSLAAGNVNTTVLLWDVTGLRSEGRTPAGRLSVAQAEALWGNLASADAAQAYQALWALVAAPQQAVPCLQQRLRPAAAIAPQRLASLIGNLDSHEFQVRQQATQELEKLGDDAAPGLRQVLEGHPSLEVRQRIEGILARLEPQSTESLRLARAVAVLEHIGNREAKELLEKLAEGMSEARLTHEAQAALQRLSKQFAP